MQAEFTKDKRTELIKGHHIKDNVQDAAVQKRSGQQTPEAMVLDDGNRARGTEKQKALIRRGQETEGTSPRVDPSGKEQ